MEYASGKASCSTVCNTMAIEQDNIHLDAVCRCETHHLQQRILLAWLRVRVTRNPSLLLCTSWIWSTKTNFSLCQFEYLLTNYFKVCRKIVQTSNRLGTIHQAKGAISPKKFRDNKNEKCFLFSAMLRCGKCDWR